MCYHKYMNIRHAEMTDFDFIYKTWKQNQKYGMSIPRKVRITERITKKEMFIIEDKVSVGMFNLHVRSLPKEMKGYKYKSDYLALKKWGIEAYEKKNATSQNGGYVNNRRPASDSVGCEVDF